MINYEYTLLCVWFFGPTEHGSLCCACPIASVGDCHCYFIVGQDINSGHLARVHTGWFEVIYKAEVSLIKPKQKNTAQPTAERVESRALVAKTASQA